MSTILSVPSDAPVIDLTITDGISLPPDQFDELARLLDGKVELDGPHLYSRRAMGDLPQYNRELI